MTTLGVISISMSKESHDLPHAIKVVSSYPALLDKVADLVLKLSHVGFPQLKCLRQKYAIASAAYGLQITCDQRLAEPPRIAGEDTHILEQIFWLIIQEIHSGSSSDDEAVLKNAQRTKIGDETFIDYHFRIRRADPAALHA